MRVVHITNYFQPELGYQDHYLARCQAQDGHDVHVITSNRAYSPQPEYAAYSAIYPCRVVATGVQQRDGYTIHRLPAYAERNMQLLLKGLISQIRSLSPDLVVAHGFTRYETVRLGLCKRLFRSKFRLVVDDHSLFSTYEPTRSRRVYHRFVRATYRFLRPSFDHIVPVTEETRAFLNARFGVPQDAMTLVPLGADVERFCFDLEARTSVRATLGINQDAIVIIFTGKVTKERKVDLVYQATEPTLLGNPSCFLLIVGTGHETAYADAIRTRVKAAGLDGQVLWHPNVPHDALPGFFSAADLAVFALPALASVEAASCGLPIVLGDTGVARERIAAGNGFVCRSVHDFESAIATLAEDPQLRTSMGLHGAQYVRDTFDWRVISRSFTELGTSTAVVK